MPKIIASINQKGGVGKTSTSYNLAYCLAKNGKRTLLIDLDPSANSTKVYIEAKPSLTTKDFLLKKEGQTACIIGASVEGVGVQNLFIVPSNISLAITQREIAHKPYRETLLSKAIGNLGNSFDYIILDCSPTLSDLIINAIYAANFFLIPVDYQEDSLDGISDLFDLINEIKEGQEFDYRILRNGFDARKKTVNSYIMEQLEEYIENGDVFETIIRQDEEINKAKISRQPVLTFNPKSSGSKDFYALTEELEKIMKESKQEFIEGAVNG